MSEALRYFHEQLLDPARFPAALAALALTAIVGMMTGPAQGNAGPLLWLVIDKIFGKIGSRLDRKERRAADLVFRGFLITALILFCVYVMGKAASAFVLEMPFYGLSEIVLLSLAMASGTTWFALLRLYFAMKEKKVSQGAYYAIARSTRIDLSGSDNYGITRTGMAFAARSFDKGLVAPVIWYLIAGLPGAYIYAGLSACAWRFGKEGFTKGFGRTALAFEKLMGFVPMIYSGILMALGGLFTPTGGMTRALIGQLWGKGKAKYEEGGLPLTAMAYSLNVSLGGPSTDLDGSSLKRAWIGPPEATARLEAGHLRRALYINLMAHLLFLLSLLGGMLAADRLF